MKKYNLDTWGKGINMPILKKATLSDKNVVGLLNIDFTEGKMVPRSGWKTFKSMIRELNKLNTKYKKLNIVGDFTIRLPIRGKI